MPVRESRNSFRQSVLGNFRYFFGEICFSDGDVYIEVGKERNSGIQNADMADQDRLHFLSNKECSVGTITRLTRSSRSHLIHGIPLKPHEGSTSRTKCLSHRQPIKCAVLDITFLLKSKELTDAN